MQDLSLQHVMNAVSKRLDAVRPDDSPKTTEMMSELEAFAAFDPLLGDLQKQYLDLRFVRKKQAQQFGKDSPMAEIAMDAEDSAWCMAQTRYIELRRDRTLMRRVQDLLREQKHTRESAAEEAAKADMQKRAEAILIFHQAQRSLEQENNNRPKSIFAWIWLFIFIDNMKISPDLAGTAGLKQAA